jgi:hypothetical protein
MGQLESEPQSVSNPYYAAALMKVALALRRTDASNLDEVLSQVLQDLAVDPQDFKRYLEANGSLVKATKRRALQRPPPIERTPPR